MRGASSDIASALAVRLLVDYGCTTASGQHFRRAAYRGLLTHARTCLDTLAVDELGLDHGSCGIDLTVINGHVRGVEIKAEADTLERLPRQSAFRGVSWDLPCAKPSRTEQTGEMAYHFRDLMAGPDLAPSREAARACGSIPAGLDTIAA